MLYCVIFIAEIFILIFTFIIIDVKGTTFLKTELYFHGWIMLIIELLLLGYHICSDLNIPL